MAYLSDNCFSTSSYLTSFLNDFCFFHVFLAHCLNVSSHSIHARFVKLKIIGVKNNKRRSQFPNTSPIAGPVFHHFSKFYCSERYSNICFFHLSDILHHSVQEPVPQSVQCLTTDWTTGVPSPTEAEGFSSNFCFQTGSGAHPTSCTMGTGGSFPGGKARSGRDADHSSPSSAEVKKE
jgi:hypothetical protein